MMDVDQGTQIGPDGERYPIGEIPEDDTPVGVPVRIVAGGSSGGGSIEGPIELEVGDIQIGAVELKDATTSARATIADGNLSVVDSAGNVLLTTIQGNVDGIEASVDGIETLLTTIDGRVDGLEGVTGTTTDAAVDTDANGTISAKLRGLIKFFRDRTGTTVPAANAEGLTVRQPPTSGTWANGAQTAVSSTAVSILAANTSRKAALIQNVGVNAVRIGLTGVTATTGWVSLPPGASVHLSQPFCPTAAIFAIREVSDSTVLASEIV